MRQGPFQPIEVMGWQALAVDELAECSAGDVETFGKARLFARFAVFEVFDQPTSKNAQFGPVRRIGLFPSLYFRFGGAFPLVNYLWPIF